MAEKKTAAAVKRAAGTPDHVDAATDGGIDVNIPDPIVEPDSIQAQRSTDPIEEDGRLWPYGAVPYYVDGKRVSRAEYVANQNGENKQATLDLLEKIVAEDSPNKGS